MTAKSAPTAAARSMDTWDRQQHQQSRMQQNRLCHVMQHDDRNLYSLYSYFTIQIQNVMSIFSSNALLQKYQQRSHQIHGVLPSVDFYHPQPQTQGVLCVCINERHIQ